MPRCNRVRLIDEKSNKTMYLFADIEDAEVEAVLLARGHLERFVVQQHETELGWFVKDKESGRVFDAQGQAQ